MTVVQGAPSCGTGRLGVRKLHVRQVGVQNWRATLKFKGTAVLRSGEDILWLRPIGAD